MKNENIEYNIIYSDRKTLCIQINAKGEVTVRAPRKTGKERIEAFVESRRDWIVSHRNMLRSENGEPPELFTKGELKTLADEVAPLLAARTAYFASIIGVTYNKITVRAQRTRYGSCSSSGNISYNCILALFPPEVIDYVIIHELCHRKHMDHSKKFWSEVAKYCPDYKSCVKWQKTEARKLIARIP